MLFAIVFLVVFAVVVVVGDGAAGVGSDGGNMRPLAYKFKKFS